MTVLTTATPEKDQPVCDMHEAIARYIVFARIGVDNVLPFNPETRR